VTRLGRVTHAVSSLMIHDNTGRVAGSSVDTSAAPPVPRDDGDDGDWWCCTTRPPGRRGPGGGSRSGGMGGAELRDLDYHRPFLRTDSGRDAPRANGTSRDSGNGMSRDTPRDATHSNAAKTRPLPSNNFGNVGWKHMYPHSQAHDERAEEEEHENQATSQNSANSRSFSDLTLTGSERGVRAIRSADFYDAPDSYLNGQTLRRMNGHSL
jgi:hypothetical protein